MSSNQNSKHRILNYQAVLEEETEGGYSIWIPDLPGCASQGESVEEALANIKEAAQLYLEDSSIKNHLPSNRRQFLLPVQINYA